MRVEVKTSVFGLGTAGLFVTIKRQRMQFFEAAYKAGIRHLNTAPVHSRVLAERGFIRFTRSRGGHLVIATKFGVVPTTVARRHAVVQDSVRRLFEAISALRKQARISAGPHSGAAGALSHADRLSTRRIP